MGLATGALDAHGQRVVTTLWVPHLGDISPVTDPASVSASSAGDTTGTAPAPANLRQLRQLSPVQLRLHPHIRVQGVVTEVFANYMQDDTAGIELSLAPAKVRPSAPLVFGDFIEVSGTGDWMEGHGPILNAETVRYLGKGQLPLAARPNWAELEGGRFVDEWIEVEGVVRSTDGSHLLLVGDGGKTMATIRSALAAEVKGLVDAAVRLRGLNVNATDDRGQLQGMQLLVPSMEYVEIERPPEDPFGLPTRAIGSLFQVSGSRELTHRVKIEGVLTFWQDGRFFIQDATGSAMAVRREDVVLNTPPGAYHWAFFQAQPGKYTPRTPWDFQPGDRLEVTGFAESREGYSPVLTEVLVRKIGTAPHVQPIPASINEIALGKLDSTLISLEATLRGQELLGEHWLLELQAGRTAFQAVMPANGLSRLSAAPGSRVRVQGICQIEPSPFPELGKKVTAFKLLMDSPASILVLERPPWLTPARALGIAAALTVFLALAAAWIGILRRQVGLRTVQLTREIEERKKIEVEVELSHKKLLHTSRLAGMAEVATSVLHNAGNVLNSANMLAASMSDQIRRSKVPTLCRAVGLLKENRGRLDVFLTQDERGRHLPDLLEQLASHLGQERNQLQDKMEALAESVEHIKEAISMQQRYARISTVTETLAVADIVNDALRLSSGSLSRHEIAVARQYEPAPPVSVDRHKVLQILINLIENAKHACTDLPGTQGRILVQVVHPRTGVVQVRVIDNGCGIDPASLPRLFSQGFSTRAEGHGFGLHSSILAAQDMGGTLAAESAGQGRGATFVLELPVSP